MRDRPLDARSFDTLLPRQTTFHEFEASNAVLVPRSIYRESHPSLHDSVHN
jgi:hypothetical protein